MADERDTMAMQFWTTTTSAPHHLGATVDVLEFDYQIALQRAEAAAMLRQLGVEHPSEAQVKAIVKANQEHTNAVAGILEKIPPYKPNE